MGIHKEEEEEEEEEEGRALLYTELPPVPAKRQEREDWPLTFV
jgi:hypothetical protein